MASLAGVAALVAGESPEPPWLVPRLEQMARMVRAYVEGEATAPKRADMRKRLDAFREAVASIREDLSDPTFVTYIGNDWSSVPLSHRDIMDTLATLGNRASTLSMAYAGRKGGADRAFPRGRDESVSSHELCAWTIMRAIMRVRKVHTVDADNPEAWKAANEYYGLCGGQRLGLVHKEPSGWREYIINVQHLGREDSARARGLASLGRMFEALPPLVPRSP